MNEAKIHICFATDFIWSTVDCYRILLSAQIKFYLTKGWKSQAEIYVKKVAKFLSPVNWLCVYVHVQYLHLQILCKLYLNKTAL